MVTSHSWLRKPRTIASFDIETVLDEAAVSAAGYKGSGMPSALQRIATACIFTATEQADGSWGAFSLNTFSDPLSEFEILMQLDKALAGLSQDDALLATYNGRAHDVAVIRRRGARHWMFGLPGIEAVTQMDHLDIMLRQRLGRRDAAPKLREACAGLGIRAYDPRKSVGPSLPPKVVKCQIDVVATFLLTLYEIAMERGSPDALIAGWDGLSDYLAGSRPRSMHLEQFKDHALLKAARKASSIRAVD